MEQAKRMLRRRHDADLKREVLAQCSAPGASVAQVAMAHGLNANLVHKWRRETHASARAVAAPSFVPVPMAAGHMTAHPAACIELDLQRGPLSVRVRWPVEAGPACAVWLREILR